MRHGRFFTRRSSTDDHRLNPRRLETLGCRIERRRNCPPATSQLQGSFETSRLLCGQRTKSTGYCPAPGASSTLLGNESDCLLPSGAIGLDPPLDRMRTCLHIRFRLRCWNTGAACPLSASGRLPARLRFSGADQRNRCRRIASGRLVIDGDLDSFLPAVDRQVMNVGRYLSLTGIVSIELEVDNQVTDRPGYFWDAAPTASQKSLCCESTSTQS